MQGSSSVDTPDRLRARRQWMCLLAFLFIYWQLASKFPHNNPQNVAMVNAFHYWVIGASRPLTGSPMGLPTFFSPPAPPPPPPPPSATEYGIFGGQTQ